MRLSIVFFTLYLGIIILSCAKADSFQTINAVELTSPNGIEILSYALQDEDFLYFSMLSPVVAGKVNKTLVATPGWNGAIQRLNVSIGETSTTGLLAKESGLLLLQGQKTTFWVSTTNQTLLYSPSTLEVNSVTSFLSNDTDGTLVANFPSIGVGQLFVLQFRLGDPTSNTSVLNIPAIDVVSSAYSPLNDVAVLVDVTLQALVYKWSTKELLVTFKIRDMYTSTNTIVYDGATSTLYTCGDQSNGRAPALARVNLSLVQNNTELSFSLNSNSRHFSNEVITVQEIGSSDMTCKALALHSSGQLVYALYDPPSSSGLIGRAIASSLDTVETTGVNTALSQKPIALLLDDSKPLIYVLTETEVAAVKLPTTFECPLDCSDRGHCNVTTNYLCVCDEPYSGHNCENPAPVEQPAAPVEQPLYEPITMIGRVDIPLGTSIFATYGSFTDHEYIYFYANCSLSISKISKANVLSSTNTSLVFSDTVIDSFGVSTALVDSQLGLVYFIGGDVCSIYQNDFNVKLVRVSMSNYTDYTVMDLSRITTAFISTDASDSTYLNMFGSFTSLRLKSSQTDNPLQSLPTVPADSEPTAVLFLPRSNTAVLSSRYSTVHYDFNNGSVVHKYDLPNGFTAMKMAADEERGKFYVIAQSNERRCLLVLTPALIPRNTQLSMNNSDHLDVICFRYALPAYSLFLDLESGQAIIVTDIDITRVNLKTHEIFDQVSADRFGLSISQSYFEPANRTLFVTSRTKVAALYIPPPCPRNCRGNGQCVYGACQCNDGFTGDQCEQVVPPVAAPVDEPASEEPVASLPISNITSAANSATSLLGLIAVAFMIAVMNLAS